MTYKYSTNQQTNNQETVEKIKSSTMDIVKILFVTLVLICITSAEIANRTNEERQILNLKNNNLKYDKYNIRTQQEQEEEDQEVNLAQILTKASLNSLTKLDAGDFVECYLLTRQAKLKSPLALNPTNSTPAQQQYVTVRKSALGFRYKERRPGDVHEKEKFELTLEYGPQRTGAVMDSEAMPTVSVGDESEGFVSWENEGKVYFETVILSSQWENAVYLCPITGAVLSKILDLALDFVTGHPRYQPFEVFDFAMDEVVLRSSSSDDFVWKMLEGMAKMYVDITPILIPPKRKLRLYVNGTENSVQKMTAVEVRGEEDGVAQFYEKFYQCAKSLITGDSTYFDAIQVAGAEESDGNETRVLQNSNTEEETYGDDNYNQESPSDESPHSESQDETAVAVSVEDETAQLDIQEEIAQSEILIDTNAPSSSPTQSPTDITETVEAVTKEAAAKEAAAQEAAAAAAMQSLLSGDGSLITSTLTPCFYDPIYKINSTVFLFIDGASYFQMKLVEPYWEAISLHESVPPPTKQPAGKGDFLDWFLVLFLSAMLLFGVLLALNKMGCAILGKKDTPYNQQREIQMADSGDDDFVPSSMADYSPRISGKQMNGPSSSDDMFQDGKIGNGDDIISNHTTPPPNNRRNPDNVHFPGVRQSSRVAVPHQSPDNEII